MVVILKRSFSAEGDAYAARFIGAPSMDIDAAEFAYPGSGLPSTAPSPALLPYLGRHVRHHPFGGDLWPKADEADRTDDSLRMGRV